MKRVRLLLPSFLMLVIPMTAQVNHALTPQQCRADADVWGVPKASAFTPNDYQFRNLTRTVVRDQSVPAKKIDARINELSMCMRMDSEQSFRYEQGSRAYNIAMWERMADFISRHNLENQFYQEDAEGKR